MIKLLKFYNRLFSFIDRYAFFLKESLLYFFNKKKLNILLKKKNPLISIIVPTFNRSYFLKTRSIRSILKQTYKNFEIIVVIDGSKDDSIQILKNFNDSRIKIFQIERKNKRYPQTAINHWFCGPVFAINHGLKKISGDWIARIDDDEIWSKKHLEISLRKLLETKSEFVSGKRLCKENPTDKRKFMISDHTKKSIYNIKYNEQIGGVNTWVYASYLSFFKANINCWRKDINRVNDTDLIERMLRVGIKVCYTNRATQIGLPREENSSRGSKYYLDNEKKIMKEYNI